jgi:hypothetical protein
VGEDLRDCPIKGNCQISPSTALLCTQPIFYRLELWRTSWDILARSIWYSDYTLIISGSVFPKIQRPQSSKNRLHKNKPLCFDYLGRTFDQYRDGHNLSYKNNFRYTS